MLITVCLAVRQAAQSLSPQAALHPPRYGPRTGAREASGSEGLWAGAWGQVWDRYRKLFTFLRPFVSAVGALLLWDLRGFSDYKMLRFLDLQYLSHFYYVCCSLSCFSQVWLFATLWTVAHQAPLSMEFSRQEHWSGLPCPPPGDLPGPGMEPGSLLSSALAGRLFTTSATS